MVPGPHVVALAGQRASEDAIASGDFAAELESALVRLRDAGGAHSELVQIRIFVTDMEAYLAARPRLEDLPAASVIEVGALLDGAQVEVEGLAAAPPAAAPASAGGEEDAVIRLRLAPADARYAGRLAAG